MPEPTPATAKKILVIDDVPQLRELARSVLQEEGFDVDVAPDATQGLVRLLANKPDLVILDLMLPGVDGFKFLEYLKQLTTPPAVVLLSGSRTVETVLRGVALGAFAFLPKPVNFKVLVETCRSALNKAAAGQYPKQAGERRAHARHTVLVQVQLVPEGGLDAVQQKLPGDTAKGVVLGEMTELSAGGARVICVAKFPVGARVQVMPDPKVVHRSKNLIAEIRTSETVDTGFRYGLQFVDLDPEVERLLLEHLAPQSPAGSSQAPGSA